MTFKALLKTSEDMIKAARHYIFTPLTFTRSKSIIETLEKGAKYVQS